MLDLKFIRDNAELVKKELSKKNDKVDVDEILNLDENRRKLQFTFDNNKAQQNKVSKDFAQIKKEGGNADQLLKDMQAISDQNKDLATQISEVEKNLEALLLRVPNIPHESVPVGKDETTNKFVREYGKQKDFNFQPQDQVFLAEHNNLLELNRGAKISGSGFPVYSGAGAILERALINYMIDFHVQKHGYREMGVPSLVNRKTMTGTGQLPKLENDMYHVDEDDLFLIPTAEVPVTNLYADEILPVSSLPVKMVSFTNCFRREAGSYGKDTRGLQRLHQFNKVEMVRLVHPDSSYDVLEEMVKDAEEILQSLGLHYRLMLLSSGDLSFASAKTYDLEVWAPGTGKYLEVSSVSNFVDFQARRAGIRFRDADGKVKFVHTLNGSGLATPRTFIAILETYQEADGRVRIPDALKPYWTLMTGKSPEFVELP
ncbi:MAG TPA: serine--tRNA ligase [Candidatus Cloacimonadota bacterium]|nr:serine--tRNA ligase [Candidatus Cloacimonadota bacterium]HPT71253.1 serine--tRNA ligase [Candidatus Cloacimonadota bacterium]